jgi:hypothetical protein
MDFNRYPQKTFVSVLNLFMIGLIIFVGPKGLSTEQEKSDSTTTPRISDTKPPKLLPKGVEFYIDYDKTLKQWRFGWLPGTNRIKTAEEVKSSMTIVGLDALKQELAKFAPGETFFVISNQWHGNPRGIDVKTLDEDTQKELIRLCSEREIRLAGMDPLVIKQNRIISVVPPSQKRQGLSLARDPIDSEGLKLIPQKFPNLEELDLRYCDLSDADLSPLGKLKHLKILYLGDNYQMHGQTFGFMASLRQLEQLDLSECSQLTDEAIAGIAVCESLHSLNLMNCKNLTELCISHLAAIKNLQLLNLEYTQVADKGLAKFADLKNLISLSLCGSRITDDDLAYLAALTKLKRLEIPACKEITIKGLQLLKPLHLEHLNVFYTSLEDSQVIELAIRLWPKCDVDLPSGAKHLPRRP